MNRFSLICAASLSLCALANAQPILPPQIERGALEPAPLIDEKAGQFVEQMMARYAALKSYADVTELRLENEAGAPANGGGWMDELGFRATLQWERPANIRFEGTNAKGAFLALGTRELTRVVSAQHPKTYVARPRSVPTMMANPDGTQTEIPDLNSIQLDEPLMGSPIPGAPSLGFMLEPEFWQRTLKDVSALNFDPDAQADGEACRVVRIQFLGDDGIKSVMRLFVAKSDGLLRRTENRDDRMPADTFIVETHSDVEANTKLPATTWNFVPPKAATAVEYFSSLEQNEANLAPGIRLGADLPTFSVDALDGAPLQLNAKSGKVTVVYFFTMNSGIYDVQTLDKLARSVRPDKLQIVGVSGDGLRARVEAFAARTKLNFPIYFDETGRNNLLARKFGVKGWASTFVFGADGKLQFIGSRPGTVEVIAAIQKLLPAVKDDAFILQDGEYLDAE